MKINLKNTILALAAFAMVGGVTAAGVTFGQAAALVTNAANTSTLTFTKACGGSGTADDGAVWTVDSDASESSYDSTKGIHYGTNKAAVSRLTLSTDDIDGTISAISVNASGASSTTAVLNVTVGGVAFGTEKNLTSSASSYNLTGSGSGEIVVTISQASAKKAVYCKSITVTYSTSIPGAVPTSIDLVAEDSITEGVKGAITAEILYDVNYESTVGTKGVTFASSDESVAVIDDVDTTNQVATVRFLDNCPTGVTITCTSEELESVSATHTFTVTGLTDPEKIVYRKVTEAPADADDWTGTYLFVMEGNGVAFDGSLNSLDVASNTFEVTILDNEIELLNTNGAFTFEKVTGGVAIKSASGFYIGNDSDANALKTNASTKYVNTVAFDSDGNVDVVSASSHLRFNDTAGQKRFRYYKSSGYTAQESISLYRACTDAELPVQKFVDDNMKFDVVPDFDDEGTGLCKTEGWYSSAKTAYEGLTAEQKVLFVTDFWFANAHERLTAWAAANGDKFNASGEIVKAANVVSIGEKAGNTIVLSSVLLLTAGLLATGGMILLSKKRKRA